MTPMPQTEENKTVSAPVVQMMKAELSTTDWPREGNVVDVTLIKKLSRKAYFDMGRFGTGIVFGAEMSNAKEAVRALTPGDAVHAKIVMLDGEEGLIELSLSEAGRAEDLAGSERTHGIGRSGKSEDRRGERRRSHGCDPERNQGIPPCFPALA